jgi:hypothetical protein
MQGWAMRLVWEWKKGVSGDAQKEKESSRLRGEHLAIQGKSKSPRGCK